jgi:hypothetical protein
MVLDGRASDHQCRVASFREGYRLRHHGRGGTRHRAVSGRRSQPDGSRFARVPHDPGARGPGRLPELVGVRSRCPGGATPRVPAALCMVAIAIRSSTSHSMTSSRTRGGRASTCQPRRSGSTRREVRSSNGSSSGGTNSCREARSWPIPGTASSLGRGSPYTDTSGPPPLNPFPRTVTGCSTWPATCGSGRPTSSPPGTPPKSSTLVHAKEPAGHLTRTELWPRPTR